MAKESTRLTAKQINDIRCHGNQCFAKGTYPAAIDAYTRCILECSKALNVWEGEQEEVSEKGIEGDENTDGSEARNTLLVALSNRAEAFLRLKNYESALKDAEKALELDPASLKSLNRKGKALEALRQYEKANQVFLAAFKQSPHDQDIREAMKRTKICSQQANQGDYELSTYFLNGCKGNLDPCCDYIGPVEISRVPNSCRGLFLTKNVTAGEILLVSNALAVAPILPEPSVNVKGVLQFQNREVEAEHLVSKLEKLARSSQRIKHQLLSLAFTDSEKHMDIPPMDLFKPGSGWRPPPSSETVELDMNRICGVAHFSTYNLHSHTANVADYYNPRPLKRTGIWPLPSFLSHSCFPNCLRMHVGNAMFVRSARDMSAGELLTIAWFDVIDPLKARQDSCRNWGFLCRCDRCIFEEGVEPLEQMGKSFFELLQVNPQEWTVRLGNLLPGVEDIIRNGVDLEPKQKNWIRASCIYAYIAQAELLRRDLERRIPFLDAIVESVSSVAAASMCCLEYSAELLRDVGRHHGTSGELYARTEKRVMNIFRIAYGGQTKKVLLSLIQNFLRVSEVSGMRHRKQP